jgi:hypothetical protein
MNLFSDIKGTLFLILIRLFSCSDDSKSYWPQEHYPKRNYDKVTINQGICGDIWFWQGNFLPPHQGDVLSVKRILYVYELTPLDSVKMYFNSQFYYQINSKLVSSVESDLTGFFQMELDPGKYSLFVWEDTCYYSNGFDGQGNIYPVEVDSCAISEVRFDITYEAAY